MKFEELTKEEYLSLRQTKSRSEIRLLYKVGPIRFDRKLESLGIDLDEDKRQRINRK